MVRVSQRFGICTKTVRVYEARAKAGQLAPLPRPGRAPRLQPAQEAAFIAMVQETTSWTIVALSQEWERRTGVALPSSTLHDHLKRLGARYKKRVASPKNAAK